MAVEIPLFPLSVVLFPHMPLPLHIFEERYRQMMRDCEEEGTSFGVVAIREGVEAMGPATPHPVGTLAQLRKVEKLDDGRYNLLVVGASRFRIAGLSTRRTYLVGEVEYLQDTDGGEQVSAELARRVGTAFRTYADTLRQLAGQDGTTIELPDDPELLSYLVSATLQVEVARKQELLEMDAVAERLRGCLALLRREAVLLDQMLARRDAPSGAFSPN
ncbi:MAG TPA: LON peptidase substrate-binding domain-containing protein [Candidatus Dormibacteraeota bacterium]|nr:LON peptidase substrate-binding domain-containing protein [Candidatus Dormibacteraeota bacterium]